MIFSCPTGEGAITSRRSSGSASATVPASSTDVVEEEYAAAAMAICCVAILMQHPTNALAMKKLEGLRQLTELIHDSEHNEVGKQRVGGDISSLTAWLRGTCFNFGGCYDIYIYIYIPFFLRHPNTLGDQILQAQSSARV